MAAALCDVQALRSSLEDLLSTTIAKAFADLEHKLNLRLATLAAEVHATIARFRADVLLPSMPATGDLVANRQDSNDATTGLATAATSGVPADYFDKNTVDELGLTSQSRQTWNSRRAWRGA